MKKNILIVTPIYPGPNVPSGFTPVVHYFAREWMKMGYNIKVISLPSTFPPLYYKVSNRFISLIESINGHSINNTPPKQEVYNWEGVSVSQYPMLKYLPHMRYHNKVVTSTIDKILKGLEEADFTPDVIVGHWENPTIEVITRLKTILNVPCSVVFHSDGSNFKQIYGTKAKEMLSNLDLIGFRSTANRDKFERNFGAFSNTFLCYSGVPKELLKSSNYDRTFDSINSFIFVGSLIRRKFPYENLIALLGSNIREFEYKVIGSGFESNKIERLIQKQPALKHNVKLYGRIPREKVAEELAKSDVFIMTSKSEVFGLVYLEAMSKGCITIASKGEAFDGIIIDGVNGFLCAPGNVAELTTILNRIVSLPKQKLIEISKNAITTATKFTDENVALDYLEHIKNITNPLNR